MGLLSWAKDLLSLGPNGETSSGAAYGIHDGEHYDGGLGPAPLLLTDYWSLRTRSAAFFKTNMYGKGIIRRFVTNVINTGLSLEVDPILSLIPLNDDSAATWAEGVEDRFEAWAGNPAACDWARSATFGRIQRGVYREALIEGDVLVVEHFNAAMLVPSYEMIPGSAVQSPLTQFADVPKGNTVEYGVELDSRRRHVAYWVVQGDLKYKRIPARSPSGREISWLVYGSEKRHAEVRGEPLLSVVLQSVGEIDKFRDSTQRKASVGSLLAVYFYHDPDSKVPNSRPISAGAQRRVVGSSPLSDGTDYKVNIASHNPGIVHESLPPGMEPKAFSNDATDEKFGEFEAAIVAGIAWSLEMPPSILRQVFGSSYSASRGEVKEFDMFLRKARGSFADQLCRKVYSSWLNVKALTRSIEMPGYLDATRDPAKYEVAAAWEQSGWWGPVKEAVDLPKEVNGRTMMAERGYTTNSAAARAMTGTSWRKNIARVARENELISAAARPLLELEKEFGTDATRTLRLVASGGDIDG